MAAIINLLPLEESGHMFMANKARIDGTFHSGLQIQISPIWLYVKERPVSLPTIFTSVLQTTVLHEPDLTGNGVFAMPKTWQEQDQPLSFHIPATKQTNNSHKDFTLNMKSQEHVNNYLCTTQKEHLERLSQKTVATLAKF
jgi:hypothetical protein